MSIAKQFRKPEGFLGKIVAALMAKGNSHGYDVMIRHLEIRPHDRLLEIGYGPGIGIERICGNYTCTVDGVDFSETMYKMAARKNSKYLKADRVHLYYGDFLTFQVPCVYDKIYFLNVIYFWSELLAPFRKIHDCLKPGGWCCFSMASRDDLNRLKFTDDAVFAKHTIEEVTDHLRKAGFSKVTFEREEVYYFKCIK